MDNGLTSTVHEVAEVYVYIPPEHSAAGVELKIVGSIKVVNKVMTSHDTSYRLYHLYPLSLSLSGR